MTTSDPARELDVGVALARLEGDGAILADLAALLLSQLVGSRSAIEAAFARRDAAALAEAAHALKGAVSAVAATRAGGTAGEIESGARLADWDLCADSVARLGGELDRLAAELALLPAALGSGART